MTLIEKLNYLLDQNDLNKRQFSIQSDIPYSTVDNWYKVGYEKMQLATFGKLCNFFGVTADSMVDDNSDIVFKKDVEPIDFTVEEKEIIHIYRSLDDSYRRRMTKYIKLELELCKEETNSKGD